VESRQTRPYRQTKSAVSSGTLNTIIYHRPTCDNLSNSSCCRSVAKTGNTVDRVGDNRLCCGIVAGFSNSQLCRQCVWLKFLVVLCFNAFLECRTYFPRTSPRTYSPWYFPRLDRQFPSHLGHPSVVKAKIWKLALTHTSDPNRSIAINFVHVNKIWYIALYCRLADGGQL